MIRREDVSAETWLIAGGRPLTTPGKPLNTPIIGASTYTLGSDRIYSRNEGTEAWEAFEALLGGLEGGGAVAFSSGMAACAAVLSQLPTGAHLVLCDDCYQGVAGIAEHGQRAYGWRVERLAAKDGRWSELAGTADMLWLESPSNPLLDCGRPRGDLRCAASAGNADRGRQHLCHATAAAPAGDGCGHRRAQRDKADRRPF